MTSAPLFLVGGGRDADALVAAHAGLADALDGRPLLCLVADDGEGIDADRWAGMLADAGVTAERSSWPLRPANSLRAVGVSESDSQ